ncbi:MAG TPA: hypothetical protein VN174_01175 [Candidatus Methanoperedens sp.]|nr:hypothetical protein [Candidatus Methanoperedens sp.]
MTNNKSFKLAAGIFGIATGVLGGVLLARKLRQESKEDFIAKIRDIFGIYNEEFRDKYLKVKNKIEKSVLEIKMSGTKMDKGKYESIVDDIVAGLKHELETTKESYSKISSYLKKDWDKIKKMLDE